MTAGNAESLARQAVRQAVADCGAQRAMVVLGTSDRNEVIASAGIEADDVWSDSTFNQRLLRDALDKNLCLLIADAKTHPQYFSLEAYRCCLVVSLSCGGFLYCDHRQSGSLNRVHLEKMKTLADQISEARGESMAEPIGHSAAALRQIRKSRSLMIYSVSVVLTGVLLLYGIATKDAEPSRATAVPTSQSYAVELRGEIMRYRGGKNLPAHSIVTAKFPGADPVVLKSNELEFSKSGKFTKSVQVSAVDAPKLVNVEVRIPRYRIASVRGNVTDGVAALPPIGLVKQARRTKTPGTSSPQTTQGSSSREREALQQLNEQLKNTSTRTHRAH